MTASEMFIKLGYKYSFDTFSHEKSIVKKYNWIDLPIRYMPYNDLKLKLLKMFLK